MSASPSPYCKSISTSFFSHSLSLFCALWGLIPSKMSRRSSRVYSKSSERGYHGSPGAANIGHFDAESTDFIHSQDRTLWEKRRGKVNSSKRKNSVFPTRFKNYLRESVSEINLRGSPCFSHFFFDFFNIFPKNTCLAKLRGKLTLNF